MAATAEMHGAEAIIVGLEREPVARPVLGSVAHKLLQLSDRPVLCVPGGDS